MYIVLDQGFCNQRINKQDIRIKAKAQRILSLGGVLSPISKIGSYYNFTNQYHCISRLVPINCNSSFNFLSLKYKFRSRPPECSTRGSHHPGECTCQTPGTSSSETGPSRSWTLSCFLPGCCSPSSGPLNKYSRVTKRIRLGIIGSAGCKLREHLKDMRGRLSDQFSSTDRHCNNKTKYFRLHLRL